ncbi:MerR family transcriptional regulator [Streptomyces sp. RKAG290]|uniref:MerR family transcriptional regulator n=1 Tax=Streptomyces sp. RKAG290 TaxID=2888348 RepID=UPI0025535D67
MSYSVGQVSAFAGVTVRTLHHYDKAGLLSPSDRSHAGYRLYSEADLVRLQQILFYRELGFPLDEIAAIFKDPQVNPLERLRARQRQLSEEIARLQRAGRGGGTGDRGPEDRGVPDSSGTLRGLR